jgi:hypothetical protein
MNILKLIVGNSWICLVLISSNLATGYLVKSYYDKYQAKKKECVRAKEEIETCNKTIGTMNELYIQDTNITIKKEKRINRVKAYKGDFVNFSDIF